MKNYSVYILECNDGTFYTGIATDVGRRLAEHQRGKGARYTRARGVKKLLYTEHGLTHSQALTREIMIKKLPRHKKHALILLGR